MSLFRHRAARVAFALLALLAFGVVAVAPAFAHSDLKSTTPVDGATLDTSPPEVTLVFTDKVLSDFTQVMLTGPDGAVELAAPTSAKDTVTQPLPTLTNGPYTLAYRIVSADSHPIAGQIAFTIAGTAASATPPASETPSVAASEGTAPAAEPSATPSPGVTAGRDAGGSAAPRWVGTAALVVLALGLIVALTWLNRSRTRG
jgi:methionine-rich copper-binding protein CopC